MSNIKIGDEVKITARIVDFNSGCKACKVEVIGCEEDKVTEKRAYIWIDFDKIESVSK